MLKQPIPETLNLASGGTLRFAIGSANGPRSNVWSVVGSKNSDDVYIGARDVMPAAKLSLHASGKWRRALTAQEAQRQDLPEGKDRVLNRWDVPSPIADGWIHAVSIKIPFSSIQTNPAPLKIPRKGVINFYDVEPGSNHMHFDILIKSAGAPELRVENVHASVGRIQLPGGGCVWVFATEFTATDDQVEAQLEKLRALAREQVAEKSSESLEEYVNPVGAGWGSSGDDGRPVIIDLGSIRQPPESSASTAP